jgi:hypothetical protein
MIGEKKPFRAGIFPPLEVLHMRDEDAERDSHLRFAGDRAGMTAYASLQVDNHRIAFFACHRVPLIF